MDICEDGARVDDLDTLEDTSGAGMLESVAPDTTQGSTDGVCLELSPGELSAKVSLERTSDESMSESEQ